MPFFPGSGSTPTALPDYSVYVDGVRGSDGGTGTVSSPFRTLMAAAADVVGKGGGSVNLNNDSTFGGGVPGQGLWLRGDDIVVPGFINITGAVPLAFNGNGNQGTTSSFTPGGTAKMYGSTVDDFKKPQVWLVNREISTAFNGICLADPGSPYGVAAPMRIGWDYVRKNDGTIEEIAISNASRAAGSTVLTLDLSTCTTFQVLSAKRGTVGNVANTVTLTVQLGNNQNIGPWHRGSVIRFATASTDFPGGDFTVTLNSDISPTAKGGTVDISYIQAGATLGPTVTVGTVVTHGFAPKDRASITSTNAQFATCCMQRVISVTATTATIRDPYGYGTRSATASANDIGTVCKQLRGKLPSDPVTINACSFYAGVFNGQGDQPAYGPTIDIGGVNAAPVTITGNSYVQGGCVWNWTPVYTNNPANVDLDRTSCSVFIDSGPSGGLYGGWTRIESMYSANGCVRWYPSADGESSLEVGFHLQDSGQEIQPNIVLVEGNSFSTIKLDNIILADAVTPAISICGGFDATKVTVGTVITGATPPIATLSSITGPRSIRAAIWQQASMTPWKYNRWNTIWNGGLSTQHRGINRALGVTGARWANLFPPLANWWDVFTEPTGWTTTQDGVGYDGNASAIKIVVATASENNTAFGAYPYTLPGGGANGGRIVFGFWYKTDAVPAQPIMYLSSYANLLFNDGTGYIIPYQTIVDNGYSWMLGMKEITTIDDGRYAMHVSAAVGTSLFYGATLAYIPPGVSDNDAWETGINMRHQPLYLPVGGIGTMEGQVLYGHGGFGAATQTKTAGAATGKVVPFYDDTGALVGYINIVTAT